MQSGLVFQLRQRDECGGGIVPTAQLRTATIATAIAAAATIAAAIAAASAATATASF